MVDLLLKGYVLIKDGNIIKGSRSPLVPGTHTSTSDETIHYAETILSHIAGQSYAHLDWQRGAIALYHGNREESERFFSKPNDKDYHLTNILRYHYGSEQEREALRPVIAAAIATLKEKCARFQNEQFDKESAYYQLEDIRMMSYPIP